MQPSPGAERRRTLPVACMVSRLLGSQTDAGVCRLASSVSVSTTAATLPLPFWAPSSSLPEESMLSSPLPPLDSCHFDSSTC